MNSNEIYMTAQQPYGIFKSPLIYGNFYCRYSSEIPHSSHNGGFGSRTLAAILNIAQNYFSTIPTCSLENLDPNSVLEVIFPQFGTKVIVSQRYMILAKQHENLDFEGISLYCHARKWLAEKAQVALYAFILANIKMS